MRPKHRRKTTRRGWNPIVVGTSAAAGLLIVVGLVWMVVHFSKSRKGDPRLVGTWQSDADATIAEMRKSRTVTAKQEEGLRKVFGKLKITYTGTTITTDWGDGGTDTQPFQIVSKDGDSVTVKAWLALSKKEEQWRVRFVGSDVFWVDLEGINMSECFRRIR